MLELVQRILARMGSDLEPDVRNEASNEIRHQYLSAAKARQMLGWSPLFTLDAGLQRTIGWYQEFFAAQVLGDGRSDDGRLEVAGIDQENAS